MSVIPKVRITIKQGYTGFLNKSHYNSRASISMKNLNCAPSLALLTSCFKSRSHICPPGPHTSHSRQRSERKRRLLLREFETFIQKKDENSSKTITNLNYFPSGLWAKVTDTGGKMHTLSKMKWKKSIFWSLTSF